MCSGADDGHTTSRLASQSSTRLTLQVRTSLVLHVVACPKRVRTDNPFHSRQPDIFGPNRDGVVNLLNSTLKHGKNVKRFVYMSSAQALLGNDDIFHVYTEVRDTFLMRVPALTKLEYVGRLGRERPRARAGEGQWSRRPSPIPGEQGARRARDRRFR